MRIVLDSGPLINFSKACLLGVLDFIPAEFYIPPAVYKEVYTYPRTKKIYAWSAVRINELIGKKVLLRTLSAKERSLVDELDHLFNTSFYGPRGPIRIVHPGELEAMVLASSMDKVLAVDERTTRLLVEDAESIRSLLRKKVRSWVEIDKRKLEQAREFVKDLFIIRSVDLVAYAYEKGYFHTYKDPEEALRSALYTLKYGGCAVSEWDIEVYMRGVR